MSKSLDAQALETIGHYDMLSPGDAIAVGLSGGADSVSLLHWLCSLRKEYKLDLRAAHLNHGLRGQESDQDEAFCRALCEKWGVPLHVQREDLSALTAGVEEAGRNARYAFFGQFNRKIALAHTLSDRAETFLMNVGRGSALRGLCSIPPVRGQIIRPLIECSRAQIEEYCTANNLSYRTDSTNADTGYRRNYIRNEVMPLLGWEAEPLRRLFRSLEADEACLSNQAKEYEGDLWDMPEAIRWRLLRGALEEQGREPSQARMKELEKQWRADTPPGPAGHPPLKITPPGPAGHPPLEITPPGPAGHPPLKRGAMPALAEAMPEAQKAPLFRGGNGGCSTEKTLRIEPLDENFIKNLPKIPKQGLANCLDCDTIMGDIIAGTRTAGDRMRLCNGAGTKSFKKLCQERGIPPGARDHLLVARDSLGPVWIEGFGCAHRCRITGKTQRVFQLTIDNEQ